MDGLRVRFDYGQFDRPASNKSQIHNLALGFSHHLPIRVTQCSDLPADTMILIPHDSIVPDTWDALPEETKAKAKAMAHAQAKLRTHLERSFLYGP